MPERGAPLAGRVALVTGASRGLGRDAALALAAAGADVVVHYNRGEAEAREVVAEIERGGRRAIALGAAIADEDAVATLLARAGEFAGGRLDLLLNNAGIYPTAPLEQVTVEEWDRVMAVNVRGPFLCSRAALPLLRAAATPQWPARIINVSSATFHRPPPAGTVAYVTSKAAVIGLTRALARELGGDGITVNCVVPSLVATEHARETFGPAFERTVAAQAIPRPQTGADLAAAIVALAGEGGAFVTGQTIHVDGGFVMR